VVSQTVSSIGAIVFDMDGVILDSREFIGRAFEDVLAARGLTVTPEQMSKVTGKPVHAMYEFFAPGHDSAELTKAHMAHHDQNLHLLKDYTGAAEVLTALQRDYKLGIFTGFNELSRQRLEMFGLSQYFETIIDTTRYTKHKPDPEGLLICLDELQVSPAKAIYVGDGISDMVAGHAAGVKAVVGITHGFSSREDLITNGADYIIDSLSELTEVLAHIG
jgi:HAD superfamily hydrolase (TIGR01509 family)